MSVPQAKIAIQLPLYIISFQRCPSSFSRKTWTHTHSFFVHHLGTLYLHRNMLPERRKACSTTTVILIRSRSGCRQAGVSGRQDVPRWIKHRVIETMTLPYRRTCPSDHLRRTTLEALLSPEHTSIERSTTRWAIGGSGLSSKGHCLGNQHGAYGSKRAAEVVVVLQLLGISGQVQRYSLCALTCRGRTRKCSRCR